MIPFSGVNGEMATVLEMLGDWDRVLNTDLDRMQRAGRHQETSLECSPEAYLPVLSIEVFGELLGCFLAPWLRITSGLLIAEVASVLVPLFIVRSSMSAISVRVAVVLII